MTRSNPFAWFRGWHFARDFGGRGSPKSQRQIVRQSLQVTNSQEPVSAALDPGRSVVYLAPQRPAAQPNAQAPSIPSYAYDPAATPAPSWPYRLG